MQPLLPLNQQEREVEPTENVSTAGGWGAMILVIVLVAAMAGAIIFFSTGDGGETPSEPAPTEAPVDPGY